MGIKQQIMSPQDIVILLKIVALGNTMWLQDSLAESLGISQSEVSKSLMRSKYAGLLDSEGKQVLKIALMEFLQYAIKYVFPQKPGPVSRGIPTSHSASPLKEMIMSEEAYVWPYARGTVRGQSIIPLYRSVPEAVIKDPILHEFLALVDALRVGRAREKQLAIQELEKRIVHGK